MQSGRVLEIIDRYLQLVKKSEQCLFGAVSYMIVSNDWVSVNTLSALCINRCA